MTYFLLVCFSSLVSVECGQYQTLEKCLAAGSYIAHVTSIELHVKRLNWRCELTTPVR